MDYEKQAEELKNYWQPKSGSFKVKALTELEEPHIEEITRADKTTTKFNKSGIEIQVDNDKYIWTFGVGKTKSSLFGQLVVLGKKLGKLTGAVFTVIIKSDGNKRDFTIVEAQEATQTTQ